MNSKERIELALAFQSTDHIPISNICAGINAPALAEFDHYLRETKGVDAKSYLDGVIDLKEIWSFDIIPGYDYNNDCWGVKRKQVSYGAGSYDEIYYYPLEKAQTVDDIKNHPWPQTSWFDYSRVPGQVKSTKARPDQQLAVSIANPFETSWYMRGLEQIFMDMMIQPEMVHAMMDCVTGFYMEHFKRFIDAADGEIPVAFTADDIGGQDGLLVSLDMWEEFIKPYHVKLNRELHNLGVKVVYHTCGSVVEAIDGLIDMGIDILQSVQTSAKGMDPHVLKEKAGKKLCFEGGVCVQQLLPFGTREKVVETTRQLIQTLGKDGGYILGPSHYIQAGTPPENIEAMFDTALTYYPF